MFEETERKLQVLAEELGAWRREHGGRGRVVPEEFWVRACELVPEVSPSRVANSLRLSYKGLKKRLGIGDQKLMLRGNNSSRPPEFFEWLVPPAGKLEKCTVKVDSPNGSRMLLELEGGDLVGVCSRLIREFTV